VFVSLDFLYTPSADVASDAKWLAETLDGEIGFTVEAMDARVAMVKLTDGPPHILLTDHLEGERPILIYRVEDFDAALADMESRGWNRDEVFEIPHGPCCSFTAPGGIRIAVYQLTRPEAAAHFDGRRDF
jgi:hypothetical protein